MTHELGESQCASFHGPAVDIVLAEAFLAAIEPAQLDLLDAVLEAQETEQRRLHQQWEERIQRAQYEAQLAQRRYNQVDPDNRLVATELERQWEEKLGQLQTTQEAHARFRQTLAASPLSPERREQFRHLSETLPTLWHSEQLANAQKKELLRTLIAKVILQRTASNTTEVKIVWVSGHYSVVSAHPPVYRTRHLHRYDELVTRIQTLWQQGHDDSQIATLLTSEGFRSPRSLVLEPRTVQRIRLENGWQRTPLPFADRVKMAGYLTVADLAQRLGTDKDWVYRRIRNHKIDPAHVMPHPRYRALMIRDKPDLLAQLKRELSP